jgi:hypothetical protein
MARVDDVDSVETDDAKKPASRGLTHINFGKIQQHLVGLTEEVRRIHKQSLVDKLRGFLFSADEEENLEHAGQLTGRVLLPLLEERQAKGWIDALESDPAVLTPRIQLIHAALASRKKANFNVYRDLLIQASLPIYIGHVTPRNLQFAVQAYQRYLNRLIHFGKHKIVALRSKQLGRVNIDRLSIKDLVDGSDEDELDPEHQVIGQEMRCANRMVRQGGNLMKRLKAGFTIPLDLSDLNRQDPRIFEGGFLGDVEANRVVPDKEALLARKVAATLEFIREVPSLHSLGLMVASRMQETEPHSAQSYLMEARIRLEATRLYILRYEHGDPTARPGIPPTFRQAFNAFRKGLQLIKIDQPKDQDLSAMGEYMDLVQFVHVHRPLLMITHEALQQMIRVAHKAMHAAAERDGRYKPRLQKIRELMRRYGLANEI